MANYCTCPNTRAPPLSRAAEGSGKPAGTARGPCELRSVAAFQERFADHLGEDEEAIEKLSDENLPIKNFYDTEIIITNLIDKLYEKARGNKETLDKLEFKKYPGVIRAIKIISLMVI